MYGVLMVTPDLPDADIGVIFIHNEGYSTMCGHACISLGRYAVDRVRFEILFCFVFNRKQWNKKKKSDSLFDFSS